MQRAAEPRKTPSRASNEQQVCLGHPRRHLWARRFEKHVDFTPHSKATRQVDPRLDREPDAREQLAVVGGLEVVEVRSGAVQVPIDRVTGAVWKCIAIPGLAYDGPSGIVELGPRDGRSPPPLA